MEVLKLNGLKKVYGNHVAVNELTFSLREHHVIGFLGPNGAGKTTTIRMIVGLIRPTSGDIQLFGNYALFGDTNSRRDIGYLPEQPALYPWMTGKEYLSFFADLYGIDGSKKEKRIDELLEIVNLRDAKSRRVGTYSNGMKQRIGIAQAVLNNPKLVIMDEPVSALDPLGRKEVLHTIERIKETSTVFFSTHILSDVDRICDDVVIINKGKLIADSPLTKLKEAYATKMLTVEFSSSPKLLLSDINDQPWAANSEVNDRMLRVWLKADKKLDHNVPLQYLLQKGIGIVKYEYHVPEIEDLFIDLLTENHE